MIASPKFSRPYGRDCRLPTARRTSRGKNSLVPLCTRLISTVSSNLTITTAPSQTTIYIKVERSISWIGQTSNLYGFFAQHRGWRTKSTSNGTSEERLSDRREPHLEGPDQRQRENQEQCARHNRDLQVSKSLHPILLLRSEERVSTYVHVLRMDSAKRSSGGVKASER